MTENPSAEFPSAEPAGFWVRAGALMIDGIVLTVIQAMAGAGLGSLLGFGLPVSMLLAVPLVYHAIMVGAKGATLGKMAAGARIVTLDGSPMTYGRAFGRAALSHLSMAFLALGYLAAPFNPEKRTFHDYAAGTRVIHPEPISSVRFWLLAALAGILPLVAVAGIAAAVAIPNFARLQGRARDGMTKANLALLRSAVLVQKTEHDAPPETLRQLVEQKTLEVIPVVHTQRHPSHAGTKVYGVEACGMDGPVSLEDSGGWGYVYAPGSFCHGKVFVDCSHEDSAGKRWSDY